MSAPNFTDLDIEYGRFTDLERLFSIKRSTAYALIDEGEIKTRYVRPRGSRTGVRLIDLNSVRRYLNSAPSAPTKKIVAQKIKAALASKEKRAEEKAKRAAQNGSDSG